MHPDVIFFTQTLCFLLKAGLNLFSRGVFLINGFPKRCTREGSPLGKARNLLYLCNGRVVFINLKMAIIFTNRMINRRPFISYFIFCAIVVVSCTASRDPRRIQIRQLQKGIIKDDTSYVYTLPYSIDESHCLVQGYFSRYSHKNRAALDFKMKKGTTIFAARNGIVVRVKKDGYKGGWNRKYRPEGNYIIVQHEDGSRAGYWHLQHDGAFVNTGDTVLQGQPIGLSGRTGYALFPHLHFLVWRFDKDSQWIPTATRFRTSKGNIYLRPFRRYKNANH